MNLYETIKRQGVTFILCAVLMALGTVVVQPVMAQEPPALTLTLSDQPLNNLLSIIGDTFGVGVVASKGATGNVNVALTKASLEEALDSITSPNGWTWIRKDNTITIMTKAEYDEYMKGNVITKVVYIQNTNASDIQNTIQSMLSSAGKITKDERTNLLQITDTPENLARIEAAIQSLDVPLDVEIFPLQYAIASDVKTLVEKIKSAKGEIQLDERTNSLIITDIPTILEKIKKLIKTLDVKTMMEVFEIRYAKPEDIEAAIKDLITKKGYIKADKRNSRIVVDDIPSNLDRIEKVIAALDQPNRIVYIEAEIVDMDYQKSLELGIDWSYGGGFALSQASAANILLPIKNWNFGEAFRNYYDHNTSLVNFNLSATAKASSKLGANTELLASPRIMVKNDETANFLVGGTQPYTTLYTQPYTSNGVTTQQQYYTQTSQEYGIKLKVKPHINADGVINLEITLENTAADPVTLNTGSSGNTFTGVKTTTSKADTIIQAKNNETVVIGGLVSKSKTESGSGIPFLENIPFVGKSLFGSRSNAKNKRNLLLFITPHVVQGSQEEAEKLYPDAYRAKKLMYDDDKASLDKKKKKRPVGLLENPEDSATTNTDTMSGETPQDNPPLNKIMDNSNDGQPVKPTPVQPVPPPVFQ